MITERALSISDLESLRMWRHKLCTTLRPRDLPAVAFRLRELSDEQNKGFSAFANSLRNACGCASGGFLASVAVMVAVFSYYASGNRLSDIGLWHVALFLGLTILSALSGKVLGLVWARWRSLRLATRIHDTIVGAEQRSVTQSL